MHTRLAANTKRVHGERGKKKKIKIMKDVLSSLGGRDLETAAVKGSKTMKRFFILQ